MSLNLKLAALAAGLTLAPLAVAEELKFASFVPPFHTVTASLIEPLAEGISSGTDGSLTMRNYPGGELGAGPVEQYVRVVQGAADFAWGLPGYTSSQFKKTMIVELPGAIPGDMMGYEALWNAYESHLAGEFPATVPVALWTSEPNVFIMKEKVVRSPADVQGLKLRVAGATAGQVATAMGATPVQMPISQVYNALQTGLIDGVITGSSTLSDFKLDEVAASVTQGAPLGRLSFYAVMSEAAYNGLSDSERAAVDVQGLKLRVAGATAGQVATAMGATPVQMPISQVYNALQTGLIDGVITGSSTLSDFKLDEVAASVTQGAPLGRLSFYAVMSEAAYNGLSDSERAAVDAASGYELSKSAEVAWNATAEAALAAAAASGENTMVQLTAAEAAAFTDVLANVLNAYVSDVGGAATMAAMNGN